MKHPHPASLILLGMAVLAALATRDGVALMLGALVLTTAALIAASSHFRLLLRRSRWLGLTMLVMFGWFTPGTPLPLVYGASQEGLLLAAENLARLLVALAVVAMMLKALSVAELVAGMRSLLAPLAMLDVSRDRIAVRLALTLEEVEASRRGDSRDAERADTRLALPACGFGIADVILGALTAALLFVAWLA